MRTEQVKEEYTTRDIQLKLLYILIEVDKKQDITCYLIAGTLLAAVRYRRLIPWGDDIKIKAAGSLN